MQQQASALSKLDPLDERHHCVRTASFHRRSGAHSAHGASKRCLGELFHLFAVCLKGTISTAAVSATIIETEEVANYSFKDNLMRLQSLSMVTTTTDLSDVVVVGSLSWSVADLLDEKRAIHAWSF